MRKKFGRRAQGCATLMKTRRIAKLAIGGENRGRNEGLAKTSFAWQTDSDTGGKEFF
jgi:hypothetical protein